MPISIVYSGSPMTGGGGDDYMIAYEPVAGANNVINAGGGDDLVIADSRNAFIPDAALSNGSIATALMIDDNDAWTTSENPFFADSSIPHASIYARTTFGEAEYYCVSVNAGQTITVDIDFSLDSGIGDTADLAVTLLDSSGNVVASSDSSSTSTGGLGSFSGLDAYLTYTAASASVYYIVVTPWPNGTFNGTYNYVANVAVTGHAVGANATGGNDVIDAGSGDDVVAGQGGNDTIDGGLGNDILIGGTGADTINGGDGNDAIYAGQSATDFTPGFVVNETVHGNAGNDIIYSTGEGSYFGDEDDDLIYAGDTTYGGSENIDGGSGIDTLDTRSFNLLNSLYTINMITGITNYNDSFINFENIVTGDTADHINATNGANIITTNGGDDVVLAGGSNDSITTGAGNDWLNGGLGADMMDGGIGDDTYIVDNVGDSVADSGGALDVVRSVITYTLGTGIENLVLFGSGIINGTGNDGNNIIIGNNQANVLDGGLGADSMRGGQGDDTYVVDNLGDRAIETPSANGFDTVYASVSFLLGTNVERLILTGSGAINGTGNASNNLMYGNDANNTMGGRSGNDNLQGNGGNDRLFGELGTDQLLGGDGNDWLQGGAGQDQLTGGAGADYFVFADGEFGTTTANADRILDFNSAQNDRIRLDQSDANTIVGGDQAYVFIGTNAFHSVAGEVRYEQVSGNTFVYGDRDGNGTADWVIRLDGLHTLNSGDFVL